VTSQEAERWKTRRDILIVSFALTAAGFEIGALGARPSVLTFLTGLLLTPLAIRVDEARRRGP
jgi:hypothetical protein